MLMGRRPIVDSPANKTGHYTGRPLESCTSHRRCERMRGHVPLVRHQDERWRGDMGAALVSGMAVAGITGLVFGWLAWFLLGVLWINRLSRDRRFRLRHVRSALGAAIGGTLSGLLGGLIIIMSQRT
jgi:hypothetical protein